MTLQNTDKFYIQRTDLSTGEEQKFKSTIGEIESLIEVNIQADLDDLSDAIKEEAILREDGDVNLQEQITGLSNRISDVGSEVFSVTVNSDYQYSVNTLCKNNYFIAINTSCAGLTGQDYIDCVDSNLDTFTNCVASDPAEDTQGRFYLVSPNYTYEQTTAILISDRTQDGEDIDFSELTVGNYIKVIERTQDVNGNDRLNDFNYGFYKITSVGNASFEEELNNTAKLHRFDVEYVSSNGKVSTTDNNFKVQIMSDFADQVSDIYVAVAGDTMTGALEIDIKDNNGNQEDTTGLVVKHNSEIARLKLTGFDDTDTSTRLHFTGTQECNVLLDSESFVVSQTNTGILLNYSEPEDNLTFHKELQLIEKASYVNVPTLTSTDNLAIVYKQYVDTRDDALALSIAAVNNRVDTLANVLLIFKYTYVAFDCDPTLPNGVNSDGVPLFGNSIQYADCVSNEINEQETQNATVGQFNYQGFAEDYVNTDGDPDTRIVDVMILQSQTIDLDSGANISVDYENLINPGDFVEMSALTGRSFAYRIYRIVSVDDAGFGNIKLKLVALSTVGNVNNGMEFSIKFFDKTSGLTLDEVNDLFVRKDGDTMTGALNLKMSMFENGNLSPINTIVVRNSIDPDQTSFVLDSLGHAQLSSIKLRSEDPAVDTLKLTIDDTIDFGTNNGIYEAVSGKTHDFKLGGNSQLTIGSNIDVHNKQIRNLRDATLSTDAVTFGQLESAISGGSYITVDYGGGVHQINWDNCNLGDLLNVSPDAPNDKQVLRYNNSNKKWEPSNVNEFSPGQRVACTNESDLKTGGFYLSPSNDLYIKIS